MQVMLTRLQSDAGLLVKLKTRTLFPENGRHYSVLDGCTIEAIGDESEAAAMQIFREFEAPAERQGCIKFATFLKVGCKERGQGEAMTEAQLRVYADALGRYPADIARKFVSEWTETEKFFPALAEVHEGCRRFLQVRSAVKNAVRKHFSGRAASSEKPRPTADQHARMAAFVAERRTTGPAPLSEADDANPARVDAVHGARAKAARL